MSTNNKRGILLDSSSVILLFRSGALPVLLNYYSCIISEGVYNELVKIGYEGSDFIADKCRSGLIKVAPSPQNSDAIDIVLGTGEMEIISLFMEGAGEFIIIDDGKGASFCRRKCIPYINALLAVKILYLQNFLSASDFSEFYGWLKTNGRYSHNVIIRADNSTPDDVNCFLIK